MPRDAAALTLSVRTLREHEACDFGERVRDLERHLGRRVDDLEEVSLGDVWWRLPSTCGVDERVWSLRCCGPEGQRAATLAAARAARRLLSAFRYADAGDLVAMVEAAEAWCATGAPVPIPICSSTRRVKVRVLVFTNVARSASGDRLDANAAAVTALRFTRAAMSYSPEGAGVEHARQVSDLLELAGADR